MNASEARLTNLLRHSSEGDALDHSESVGRHLAKMKALRRKYHRNEITLLDIYEYYRIPLSVYTSKKIRNVFVVASLCLTVYLTSHIESLRGGQMPVLGINLSSTTLVVGAVFVLKETAAYVLNLRKMMSIFCIYRYILNESPDEATFRRVVRGIMRLEREVHRRRLTRVEIRDIVNRERFLLLLMIRHFPEVFRPMCSRFLLYILRLYIHKISDGELGELRDEIRVVSVAMFILSPVVSAFFILYYVARTIGKSQTNAFYIFRKAYKPTFRFFTAKKTEYPHETQRRVHRSARYLNDYSMVRKKDYIAGICSAVSFFLSCLIFFVVYLILNTLLTNKADLRSILYQDIRVLGRTTNVIYLSYFIGAISCCLRCLSFSDASINRRRTFTRWCGLMEQEMLVKYAGNRRYLSILMARFFVPRFQLFAVEIISPFVIPFQLDRMRQRLEQISILFSSSAAGQSEYRDRNLEEHGVAVLNL